MYEKYGDRISEEPLLEKAEIDQLRFNKVQSTTRMSRTRSFCFHGFLVILYSTFFFISWLQMREHYIHGPRLTYGTQVSLASCLWETH